MRRVYEFAVSATAILLFTISAQADTAPASYGPSDKDCDATQKCDDGCAQKCDDGCAQKDGCGAKGECGGKGCGCCDSCYLFGPDEAWTLFNADNCWGINVGGWFQLGYHSHATPLSAAYGDGLSFNDVPHQVNLHQSWLFIEKVADTDCRCWDWGFRTDIVYGTDAQKTQAFGQDDGWDVDMDNGVYGWAIPQAYAELAVGDLSVIGGHFYTLIGYEVVTAPDNFFYSHSLTMFNAEPFTHTGVLGTYSGFENVELYGGWTAGWDTGFRNDDGGSNFLGGFSLSACDNLSFTYINTFGDFGWRGSQGYSHSLVFDLAITERLNYVLQSDLLSVNDTGEELVGINNYLFYTINDCLAFGTRTEWLRNNGDVIAAPGDYYEWTTGMNVRPHANFVVRPEIRYDWNDGAEPDLDSIWTFGIDAIFTF
jgi:hypothetical protein